MGHSSYGGSKVERHDAVSLNLKSVVLFLCKFWGFFKFDMS